MTASDDGGRSRANRPSVVKNPAAPARAGRGPLGPAAGAQQDVRVSSTCRRRRVTSFGPVTRASPWSSSTPRSAEAPGPRPSGDAPAPPGSVARPRRGRCRLDRRQAEAVGVAHPVGGPGRGGERLGGHRAGPRRGRRRPGRARRRRRGGRATAASSAAEQPAGADAHDDEVVAVSHPARFWRRRRPRESPASGRAGRPVRSVHAGDRLPARLPRHLLARGDGRRRPDHARSTPRPATRSPRASSARR